MSAPMTNPGSEQRRRGWWRTVVEKVKKVVEAVVNYEVPLEESHRGNLMTVTTLIATITYQAALNPPGGVWQSTTQTDKQCNFHDDHNICLAGTAVLAIGKVKHYFKMFMVLDTIAFTYSLAVLFFLVSGFPLKNKFSLWVLTFWVYVTVSILGFSFFIGLTLVLPFNTIYSLHDLTELRVGWSVLVGVVGLFVGSVVLVNAVILLVQFAKRNKHKVDGRRARRDDGFGGTSHGIAADSTTEEG